MADTHTRTREFHVTLAVRARTDLITIRRWFADGSPHGPVESLDIHRETGSRHVGFGDGEGIELAGVTDLGDVGGEA